MRATGLSRYTFGWYKLFCWLPYFTIVALSHSVLRHPLRNTYSYLVAITLEHTRIATSLLSNAHFATHVWWQNHNVASNLILKSSVLSMLNLVTRCSNHEPATIHIYTYIYIYRYVYTYDCTYISIHIHVQVHVHIHMHIHTYTHTYIHPFYSYYGW